MADSPRAGRLLAVLPSRAAPALSRAASAAEADPRRARLGRRTKDLVKRLRPGDVAVIDHVNIDRIAAEELLATGVRAVINASPSSDGRYPNAGPLLLAHAGVALIDATVAGGDPFELLEEGAEVTIEGGVVSDSEGGEILRGHVLGVEELERRLERAARAGRRGAGRVRREHRRPRAPGDRPADRRDRVPGDQDLLPRPPGADRRPRRSPPARPEGAQRLHPRRAAARRRRRRRRRRLPGSRPEARRDPRRHGLGRRRGAALRRRADRPRLPRRPRAGPRAAARRWA